MVTRTVASLLTRKTWTCRIGWTIVQVEIRPHLWTAAALVTCRIAPRSVDIDLPSQRWVLLPSCGSGVASSTQSAPHPASQGRTWRISRQPNSRSGAITMKFALRVFTMLIVFAGIAAASMSPARTMPAAFSMLAGPLHVPAPGCGPGVPTCPQNPPKLR